MPEAWWCGAGLRLYTGAERPVLTSRVSFADEPLMMIMRSISLAGELVGVPRLLDRVSPPHVVARLPEPS